MEGLTQKEAANRLGISTSWLRRLTKRGAVRRNSNGSYAWPEVRDQHRGYVRASDEKRAVGFGDREYQSSRARKAVAQARLLELEVAKRERALIPVEEHLERIKTSSPSPSGPRC